MEMVLVQSGKRDVTDYVSVHLFSTREEAELFVDSINGDEQNRGKYWKYAGVVGSSEQIEVGNPWYNTQLQY